MADQWITVPNWDTYQHYGNRKPIWIKNYIALLHKDEYLDLTFSERGLLHGIWLAYAERRGHVRAGRDLAAELHGHVREQQLASLNQAGLVGLSASRPLLLSTYEVDARAREGKPPSRRRAAEAWIRNGAAAQVPASQLEDVIRDEFHIDDAELVAELLAEARGGR